MKLKPKAKVKIAAPAKKPGIPVTNKTSKGKAVPIPSQGRVREFIMTRPNHFELKSVRGAPDTKTQETLSEGPKMGLPVGESATTKEFQQNVVNEIKALKKDLASFMSHVSKKNSTPLMPPRQRTSKSNPNTDENWDIKQVLNYTGIAYSTLYKMIQQEKFPRQVPIGARSVRWLKSEVVEWMDKKKASRQEDIEQRSARGAARRKGRADVLFSKAETQASGK